MTVDVREEGPTMAWSISNGTGVVCTGGPFEAGAGAISQTCCLGNRVSDAHIEYVLTCNVSSVDSATSCPTTALDVVIVLLEASLVLGPVILMIALLLQRADDEPDDSIDNTTSESYDNPMVESNNSADGDDGDDGKE
eukprot:COSAG01_NODE_3102_length_6579_cov_44.771605_5_plen_138_part_00